MLVFRTKQWWENEANADLIQWAMIAFVVALFMTFVLLVYMFNSFSKPAIVLYSIFTALLWVNIGLWVTGNPYSMAFAIWIYLADLGDRQYCDLLGR
jgi:multidrug efflux pump subunit AcrB